MISQDATSPRKRVNSKLRDIFDAAHIEKYDDHGSHFTADDWVKVFIMRARQITEKKDPCP